LLYAIIFTSQNSHQARSQPAIIFRGGGKGFLRAKNKCFGGGSCLVYYAYRKMITAKTVFAISFFAVGKTRIWEGHLPPSSSPVTKCLLLISCCSFVPTTNVCNLNSRSELTRASVVGFLVQITGVYQRVSGNAGRVTQVRTTYRTTAWAMRSTRWNKAQTTTL